MTERDIRKDAEGVRVREGDLWKRGSDGKKKKVRGREKKKRYSHPFVILISTCMYTTVFNNKCSAGRITIHIEAFSLIFFLFFLAIGM